jgi:hypothetical protein
VRLDWGGWLCALGVFGMSISVATAQPAQARGAGGAAVNSTTPDGRIIFGPPPPVAPEVITRDEDGRATVRAVPLVQPFKFDGVLDDAIYATVKPITGFVQSLPHTGQPVTERTEAWVFFDSDNIYISCRCWDSAPPSEWVANEMRRDGNQVRQNDNFGVVLDTFYDRRNGIFLYANPIGGLIDLQYTNEGNINQDWNAIWDVKTGRFDGGWSMEIQIPFKSLRYRPGASQIWGMQLRRSIRRRSEFSFMTPTPPDGAAAGSRISQAPTLVGIVAPPGSRNFDLKPYAIGGLKSDSTASPAVSNDPSADFGFDTKYGLTQNMTLDFTYNTDFAQVEVDEQQVNLTRFNLVFPEKREFFLEGRGLYEFGHGNGQRGLSGPTGTVPEFFFTRQIGLNAGRVVPIIAGARLTGKVGKFGFGLVNIQTDDEPVSKAPKTNFTVLRLRRDLLRRSGFGVMVTNRSESVLAPGRSNRAYGADAAFSFFENVNFNTYYARTETPGLAGRSDSYLAHFDFSPDRYGAVVEHLLVGDAYNPEVGFVRRGDMRRTYLQGRFSPRPKSIRGVRRLAWEGSLEYIENTAGILETRQQLLSFDVEFDSSDRVGAEYSRNYELLVQPFRVSRTVTIPAGGYSFGTLQTSYSFGSQRKGSGTLSFGKGEFYDGSQTSVGLGSGRLELTPQFSLEPSMTVTWIDLPYGDFTTQVYRARTTYTFSPHMFVSGLLQYNSGNRTMGTNVRLRWEYTPGSDLFIVYTEDRDTVTSPIRPLSQLQNRGLVIKFNRLLRF